MSRLIVVVVMALLVPGRSSAQDVFTALTATPAVKAGDPLIVTCDRAVPGCEKGRVRGRLSQASRDDLRLSIDDQTVTIPADRVLRIEQTDGIGNGVGIGMGIGALGGAVLAAIGLLAESDDAPQPPGTDWFQGDSVVPGAAAILGLAAMGAGVGAAIGAGVDAMRDGSRTIFERPWVFPETRIGMYTSRGGAGLQVHVIF